MNPSEFAFDVEGFQAQYLWLMIIGGLAAFLMAFGIGANDVANAFGTSVGAKSITFRQAVVMAAFCETFGAIVLGADVTTTVRKGIVDVDLFKYNPELLMAGMFAALLAAGIWLIGCSYYGLPVSTTHSIIGALIGMGLATAPASVQWSKVGLVVLSWLTSPVLSGILASFVYVVIRWAIMRRGVNGPKYALLFYPGLLFFLMFTISLLGAFKIPLDELKAYRKKNAGIVFGVVVAIAVGAALIVYLLTIKWMKNKLAEMESLTGARADGESDDVEVAKADESNSSNLGNEVAVAPVALDEGSDTSAETPPVDEVKAKKGKKLGAWLNVKEKLNLEKENNMEADLDEKGRMLHDDAEKFPANTEAVFNYLQVTSACFDSIAHGSNDVANAIGPLAAMISIFANASVGDKTETPIWISVVGGITISIGLLLYGYKVLQTIGTKLTKITPCRGFSMETGATLVIVGGSALGIPLSTTHCQVGATMGVGFCETKSIKNIKGVNLGLFAKIVAGWIMTLVFTAGLAIIVYTIVAVVLFPRIEAYSCGDLAAPLSLAATAMTLMTEYSQPADLQNYLTTEFKKLDTDGDEFLSQIELEVNTAKQVAKDGISSFGSGKKLSQQQFINWRCGGTGLETLQDGCVPICANPDHIVEPIECKLHVQEKPSFQLIAKYNFEEQHAGCVAPPTTTTTAPAEQ